MARMIGSAIILVLTATAAVGSPPHSSQHRIPEGRATIRGPALHRPLKLAGEPFFDLVFLTGLVPDWSPPPPGQRMSEPSAGEIGKPHDVSYSFPIAGQETVHLDQTIYLGPGSPGEVWVETGGDQFIPLVGGGRLNAPAGWWRSEVLGDFLRAVMTAEGGASFPPAVAEYTSPEETAPVDKTLTDTAPPTEQSSASRVLAGLVALSLLLLIGAVVSRPGDHRASRPTPS